MVRKGRVALVALVLLRVALLAQPPSQVPAFLIVNDGTNQQIWTLRRDTLAVVSAFGHAGHGAGEFYGAHVMASDSKGNLFIGETYEGTRIQKFTYRGLAPPQAPLIR